MLETIVKHGIIFYAMGIMLAVGIFAKVISHVTVRKMAKAASEIQNSNHKLMKLVKAKFEHASMVSDKVQNVEVFVKNLKDNQKLVYTIYDKDEKELDKIETTESKVTFEMKDVNLWHGRRNPYLYCCEVEIVEGGEVVDNVCNRFGSS